MDLALDRSPQQPVPGRIELDLVDAVAEPVVRTEDREIALGPAAVLPRLGASRRPRRLRLPGRLPSRRPPLERLPQRQIDLEQVTGSSGGAWLSTSRTGSETSVVAMTTLLSFGESGFTS